MARHHRPDSIADSRAQSLLWPPNVVAQQTAGAGHPLMPHLNARLRPLFNPYGGSQCLRPSPVFQGHQWAVACIIFHHPVIRDGRMDSRRGSGAARLAKLILDGSTLWSARGFPVVGGHSQKKRARKAGE